MGLQGVTEDKIKEISKCLGNTYHFFMGESAGVYRNQVFNPIFFENSRYLKPYYRKSGTFWLSKTPAIQGSSLTDKWGRKVTPRACTWIKINFLQKTSEFRSLRRTNRFKILNLLKVFAGKVPNRAPVSRMMPERKVRQHVWTTIYVANTQLDNQDEKVANEQVAILKNHIREEPSVMDRRRYPFVFMIDLGWSVNSKIYKASQEDGWLIDSLKYSVRESRIRFDNRNFIMRSRLKSLVGDSVLNSDWSDDMRNSQNRPVFAAYLSDRSPTKNRETERSRNLVTARD